VEMSMIKTTNKDITLLVIPFSRFKYFFRKFIVNYLLPFFLPSLIT